jgi:uncharacterized protein YciI
MPLFAVTYRYESDQAEEREANKPDHRRWLSGQVDAGAVRTVGPFLDGSGALLVVEADDDEAARSLVNADPHCLQGLVPEVTVREWKPVFGLLV